MWFKQQLGWDGDDIRDRLVTCYPQLLSLSVEKDLEPFVSTLRRLEYGEDQIRMMLQDAPVVVSRELRPELQVILRVDNGPHVSYSSRCRHVTGNMPSRTWAQLAGASEAVDCLTAGFVTDCELVDCWLYAVSKGSL